MARDHRKLHVFDLADRLASEIYKASEGFPRSEQFGLQTQLRRAGISAASNIVEGCARRTTREYLSFLNVAAGSAAEAGYLAGLSARLGFLNPADGERIAESYNELVAKLVALINSLNNQP